MAPWIKYKPLIPSMMYTVVNTSSDDGEDEFPPSKKDTLLSSKSRFGLKRALIFLGSLLAVGLYTWAVLYYAREFIYKPFCPRLTAPDTIHVWDEVRFSPQLVDPKTPDEDDPLLGSPSPELDANWSTLLSAFANRISESEVQRLGMQDEAIPFNDEEGGYIGGLGLAHNLHCIQYLYQVSHRDYYYAHNTTEKEDITQKGHIRHCLHHIMESVKCQADLTPVLLQWTLNEYRSVINWRGVERTCADWSQLMEWGERNSVRKATSIYQFRDAKHPIYGNFLDENGEFGYVDREGEVDFAEFFKTPEYQEWAKEKGIGTGEAAAEAYLRSTYTKEADI